MTTIYLIRHAEAEGNVYRRLHGQYDSMITRNGKRQIAALRERFASVPIAAVYASDLTRTCTTASAIFAPKGLPLQKEPRFREIHAGVWEDIPFGQLAHDDPERMNAFSHSPKTWSVEGSEPFAVYTARFLEALEEVARRHDGQSVAIFSHGMVLRGTLQTLFFPNDENAVAHCENTAVTCLHYENGRYTLEYLNDASHIPYEISTLGRQRWWRGGEHRDFNMWFRAARESDAALIQTLGCRTPTGAQIEIAMLADVPVGAVVTQTADASHGVLIDLALLPEHRGIGLSAQLVGQVVCSLRRRGVQWLRLLRAPETETAKRLFAAYGLSTQDSSIVPAPEIIA